MISAERAAAYFKRQRDAYWKRRNEPPVEDIRPIEQAAEQLLGGTSNRRAGRSAGRYRGVSRSQRHRPARPSAKLVCEAQLAAARRAAREAAKRADHA